MEGLLDTARQLRVPLTTIAGYAEGLRTIDMSQLRQEAAMHNIERAVGYATAILDDIEAGVAPPDYRANRPGEVARRRVDKVWTFAAAAALDRDVRFPRPAIDAYDLVLVEPQCLRPLLLELVSTAVEQAMPCSTVTAPPSTLVLPGARTRSRPRPHHRLRGGPHPLVNRMRNRRQPRPGTDLAVAARAAADIGVELRYHRAGLADWAVRLRCQIDRRPPP